jgi:hypothetical protein
MPTPKGYASYIVDLGLKADGVDIADADIVVISGICPIAGTIKEIWAGVGKTLPTDAALNVYKAGTTDASLLTGGTAVDLEGFTVNVAQSLTLVAGSATLRVAAGDMLSAVYTMTDITAGDDAAFACVVIIEPDVW